MIFFWMDIEAVIHGSRHSIPNFFVNLIKQIMAQAEDYTHTAQSGDTMIPPRITLFKCC